MQDCFAAYRSEAQAGELLAAFDKITQVAT